MFINHTSKQVTAKIVYYGTGLSGKTTNLQYIYSITKKEISKWNVNKNKCINI